MILVIDGYNLLKLIHGPNVTEMQRSAFINLLGRYIKKRKHKVIVVFDAGPCTYPMHEKQRGVTIIYSGSFQSADDSIIKFAQENAQKEVVVISADRALLQEISEHNADSIDPLTFYEKVKEVCTASEKMMQSMTDKSIIKFTSEAEAIDALMYEAAAMTIPYKDDQVGSERGVKKNDLSKKDKLRIKAINKL